jgi:FkbM family methyltransferase
MSDIRRRLSHRLVSFMRPIMTAVSKNHVYTARFGGEKFKLRGDLGFWLLWRRDTGEERFLTALSLNGKTVYDVGSYIGVLTVFFAKTVGENGRVVAFEPNPENCAKAKGNVKLNSLNNVQLMEIGIGSQRRTTQLTFPRWRSGAGSMDDGIRQRIVKDGKFESIEVQVDTLDNCVEVNKLPTPDLVKIDIEGMEYDALVGMAETIRRHKPALYVEIHGADVDTRMLNAQRLWEFLCSRDYSISHVESGQAITDHTQIAKEGHIYCWHAEKTAS